MFTRSEDGLIFRNRVVVFNLVMSSTLMLTGCISSNSTESTGHLTLDIKDISLTSLSSDCADYSDSYFANVEDIKLQKMFLSQVEVSGDGHFCTISANDIPNYDFNDNSAHWATPIAEQVIALSIPRNPTLSDTKTDLSLLTYNAVMLNGVVLDQIANGCYKPADPQADSDGNVSNGCGLWVDWRLDPMGKVKFGTDSHNAHTQPGGLYHYHGSPNALFDPAETNQASPVIGFAADGFPIFGPYFTDEATGEILKAESGYTLKSGLRPISDTSPGGSYDGTYIQDYEFTGVGTLDECNGMTIGDQYGYYITDSYPYVMGCYSGTPDLSFSKVGDIVKISIAGIAGLLLLFAGLIILLVRRRRKKAQSRLVNTNETGEKE